MAKHILIIDDDRDIAGALVIRLKASGYAVTHAPNGLEGVEAATRIKPDAILLDIRMPDIDGFEVNRRLKEDPELGLIPVILLSANLRENARKQAVDAGIHEFFSKPYDVPGLMNAIKRMVED